MPIGISDPGLFDGISAPLFLGQGFLFERHGFVPPFHSSEIVGIVLPLIGFLIRLWQVAAPTAGAAPRYDTAVDEAPAGVAAAHGSVVMEGICKEELV